MATSSNNSSKVVISAPPLLPREKLSFGTRYDIRDALLNSINSNVLSKSHGFASHFLDRNIQDKMSFGTQKVVFYKVFEFLCCSLVLNRKTDNVILRLKIDKRN